MLLNEYPKQACKLLIVGRNLSSETEVNRRIDLFVEICTKLDGQFVVYEQVAEGVDK